MHWSTPNSPKQRYSNPAKTYSIVVNLSYQDSDPPNRVRRIPASAASSPYGERENLKPVQGPAL
jgi:hypothetical protein